MVNKHFYPAVVDASSKIPSGILEGTLMDFGSFEECLQIKVLTPRKTSNRKELFRGRYCMMGFHSPLMSPFKENSAEGKSYVDRYGNPPEWVGYYLITHLFLKVLCIFFIILSYIISLNY